jgi:hypothetical protein
MLHVCETFSLILRYKYRLRVFENKALGNIAEPKGEEVTGEWRRLRYEELYGLYSSRVIKSGRKGLVRHVALLGEKRGACRASVGNFK